MDLESVSVKFSEIKQDAYLAELYSKIYTIRPYFGPFLQSLYTILGKWSELHPDVLFTATEIISVLASSRIPLINTLFLDISLTLQPSYPSFSSQLHSIRNELDSSLKNYPDYLFRHVWKSASRECLLNGEDAQFASRDDDDSSPSFVNTLRRTIASNRSFRMAAEEMQRTVGSSGRSSFRALSGLFKSSRESTHPSEFRLLSRASSSLNSEEEEQAAKIMCLRSVLFTHWMLELGAIAMQLCWGRKLFHGSHQGISRDFSNGPVAANADGKNTEYDDSLPPMEQNVTTQFR